MDGSVYTLAFLMGRQQYELYAFSEDGPPPIALFDALACEIIGLARRPEGG